MKKRPLSLIVQSIAAILPLTFSSAAVVAQTHELITLTDFGQTSTDATYPVDPLVFDKAGNLYGVTPRGGPKDWGTVFELTRKPDGVWARKTLYAFGAGADGGFPDGALVLDAAGNLYGTAGAVFELSPRGDGSWTHTVLYKFAGYPDGSGSGAGVIFDSAGNLYGTTDAGGIHMGGTIFELTPQEGGGWKESILYSFANAGPSVVSGLTMDQDGNLYGTTNAYELGSGVVFKLSRGSDGSWSYTPLHTFSPFGNSSGDGSLAESGVILDAHGNLYGTAIYGGAYNRGAVFEVPAGQGPNGPDKILYSFDSTDKTRGGIYPEGGLVIDPSGNLYGTTDGGGVYGYGKIFEMLPNGDGTWTMNALHNFGGQKYNGFTGIDGKDPEASMILDADGNLYGTTYSGGYQPNYPFSFGGVAFELKLH
jgi:uncharacterized repeat protein (TIGR03803 family)